MSTVISNRSQKTQIVIAGTVSILAQGMLLLPINIMPQLFLPYWRSLILGVVLFTIATFWIVSNIRVLKTGWRGNAHFILNQAVIVIVGVIALAGGVAGAFALIDGDGDGDGEPSQQSGETPGGEQPGGEQPGGEQPGGEQPGGEQPGGEQPGGEPLDVPRPGGASVGPTHATPGAPASGVD
jgi:hypothetical protein